MKSVIAVFALASMAIASPLVNINLHTGSGVSKAGLHSQEDPCLLLCLDSQPQCGTNAYPKQFGECWTCCIKTSSVQHEGEKAVDQAPLAIASPSVDIHTHAGSDAVQTSLHAQQDICWRACFAEQPQCPEGWYSKQFGGCWTCCTSPEAYHEAEKASNRAPLAIASSQHVDIDLLSQSTVVQSGLHTQQDICWLACFAEQPQCPEGWISKKHGECWTCCIL